MTGRIGRFPLSILLALGVEKSSAETRGSCMGNSRIASGAGLVVLGSSRIDSSESMSEYVGREPDLDEVAFDLLLSSLLSFTISLSIREDCLVTGFSLETRSLDFPEFTVFSGRELGGLLGSGREGRGAEGSACAGSVFTGDTNCLRSEAGIF